MDTQRLSQVGGGGSKKIGGGGGAQPKSNWSQDGEPHEMARYRLYRGRKGQTEGTEHQTEESLQPRSQDEADGRERGHAHDEDRWCSRIKVRRHQGRSHERNDNQG